MCVCALCPFPRRQVGFNEWVAPFDGTIQVLVVGAGGCCGTSSAGGSVVHERAMKVVAGEKYKYRVGLVPANEEVTHCCRLRSLRAHAPFDTRGCWNVRVVQLLGRRRLRMCALLCARTTAQPHIHTTNNHLMTRTRVMTRARSRDADRPISGRKVATPSSTTPLRAEAAALSCTRSTGGRGPAAATAAACATSNAATAASVSVPRNCHPLLTSSLPRSNFWAFASTV